MTRQDPAPGFWPRLPAWLRAIVLGLLIAMLPANIWLLFLASLRVPLAAIFELVFLVLYVWWASGGGRPYTTQAVRGTAFRAKQRTWGLIAAVFFAATVHASIVLLFRLVPYPAAAFRQGYDLSPIPSLGLKWLVVVISAVSAGICEETGFRGCMQRPMEQRYGTTAAILTSSLLFTLVHLSKGWALAGMVPIVFGAGVLLGTFGLVFRIAHSRHGWAHIDGCRPVRILVDRRRRELHGTADRGRRNRSSLRRGIRCIGDFSCAGTACSIEAKAEGLA
jgi:membrane protease YdiL (CAAX protease family)